MAGAGIRALAGEKPMGNKALSAFVTARGEQAEMLAKAPHPSMIAGLREHLAKHFPEASAAGAHVFNEAKTAKQIDHAMTKGQVSAAKSTATKVKAPRSAERNVELLHKLQDRFQSVAVSSPRSPEHRQAFARLTAARKLAGPEHVEAAAAGRHARTMAAVEKYRTGAEAKLASGNEKITAHEGDRYVRLSKGVPGDKFGGSAHSFVDKTNGDILKADTYKRPAKNARGNVFDKTPENAASAYSAKYMREIKPPADTVRAKIASTERKVPKASLEAIAGGRVPIHGPRDIEMNGRQRPVVASAGANLHLLRHAGGEGYALATPAGKIVSRVGTQAEGMAYLRGAGTGKTLGRAMSTDASPVRSLAIKAVNRYQGILQTKAATKGVSAEARPWAAKGAKIGGSMHNGKMAFRQNTDPLTTHKWEQEMKAAGVSFSRKLNTQGSVYTFG